MTLASALSGLVGGIKLGLEFFSRFFNSVSDQKVVVSEDDKHWIWTITTCPVCCHVNGSSAAPSATIASALPPAARIRIET